ncbi:MAG: hypothetical protein JRD92_12190 [Deltaproteobacteria bacterium]|nr:hypothetical protein [Deltaproteobacteria bacterium]MBW1905181.1 hypothetical protein [Deltaproteobacteria bacterium]MBW2160347.1 hypothetical protein [Deltaproteobacteria bacterium]MBW2380087.1 hypothetical protein [Deltaproteobacteria bacterium]MBW2587688.1 hypothetical protein [Deltaproteobacteria bacterium]
MRYSVGFACMLAALAALPLSASGQDAAVSASLEPSAEESASEPASEEPALQLQLDAAGVDVAPSPPRTVDGYTLEELELRKRRAAFGLIAPAALTVPGVTLLLLGMRRGDCVSEFDSDPCRRLRTGGLVLTIAGGVGMIVGSIVVGVRTGELKLAAHNYALEELELRVKRGKIGVYVSAGVLVAGILMGGIAYASMGDWGETSPKWTDPVAWTGVTFMMGGFFALISTGAMLRVRKRALRRELQEAHYGRPRRVQWDLAQSQLVF